jgi:predicted HAD superfamily Cof-like phosphohydrolase
MGMRFGVHRLNRSGDVTPAESVRQFHEAFNVAVNAPPTRALLDLRASLLSEECAETLDGMRRADLLAVADGLADLVYVSYGAAISLGIDLDLAIAEVHRSNMSKLGSDGEPILRQDGKVLKGPNYRPPDLTRALPTYNEG